MSSTVTRKWKSSFSILYLTTFSLFIISISEIFYIFEFSLRQDICVWLCSHTYPYYGVCLFMYYLSWCMCICMYTRGGQPYFSIFRMKMLLEGSENMILCSMGNRYCQGQCDKKEKKIDFFCVRRIFVSPLILFVFNHWATLYFRPHSSIPYDTNLSSSTVCSGILGFSVNVSEVHRLSQTFRTVSDSTDLGGTTVPKLYQTIHLVCDGLRHPQGFALCLSFPDWTRLSPDLVLSSNRLP